MGQEETLNKKKHILSTRAAVLVLSFISCGLWGSAPICIKLGYEFFQIDTSETMNMLLFAGLRFSLAGLLVIVFYSLISRKPVVPRRTSWRAIIWLALFQTVIQYLFYYIGVANASGVKAAILSGSPAVISVIIACLIVGQEKMTRNKLIGCTAGVAGIILVNVQGNLEALTMDMSIIGEGFVLLSTTSGSISSVLIRKFSQDENPVMLCGWQFFTGGLFLCAVALLGGGRIEYPTVQGIGILVYLAFVSAVAYSLRSLLLKYNSVSSVTIYGFITPIVGVFLAAVLLGEKDGITLSTVAAMALICLSIWVVNFAKTSEKNE